ncbi:MAG: hypothetical protein QF440_07320 [Candidatus Thalassarchaeaceae archaeon]|nr:hypothetical protein [Candidatus Thalassarchaeaceae archaeon]
MELPITSIPPRHVLTTVDRVVIIGTDGGIAFLHPNRLIEIDAPKHPFSGEISKVALLGENFLAATWIEREIGIARMAVLDIREPLANGPDLISLREASDNNRLDSHQVEGAIWSHVLSAEPLAMCEHNGSLVFCTYNRGFYRVDINSIEIWRRKHITWSGVERIPDGDVIADLISSNGSIWAFSLGGGWAEINADDGEIIRKGVINFGAKLESVWNDSDEWIIGLSHQRIAKWNSETNDLEIECTNGPIKDAKKIDSEWVITGWREDLIWTSTSLQAHPRPNIGIHIMDHSEHGLLVLDNCNQWSIFGHNNTEAA